jgi:biotin carboxyl carrier protein
MRRVLSREVASVNRRYIITIDGTPHEVILKARGADSLTFSVAGESHHVTIEAPIENTFVHSEYATTARAAPATKATQVSSAPGELTAPMPGIVGKLSCAVGDTVKRGTPLIVIEAMKMENNINAPMDGTVSSIHIKAGDEVKKGDRLVTVS